MRWEKFEVAVSHAERRRKWPIRRSTMAGGRVKMRMEGLYRRRRECSRKEQKRAARYGGERRREDMDRESGL